MLDGGAGLCNLGAVALGGEGIIKLALRLGYSVCAEFTADWALLTSGLRPWSRES